MVEYGNRWGTEGPPPDAYSRVTTPERFRPLHEIADDLIARLEREYLVSAIPIERDEILEPRGVERFVRLLPESGEAAPITIAFTNFPGLKVRFGYWHTYGYPFCGCDACDEALEDQSESFSMTVEQAINGRFTEAVHLPLIGSAWLHHAFPGSSGRSLVERDRAKDLIAFARTIKVAWRPWTRRDGSPTA